MAFIVAHAHQMDFPGHGGYKEARVYSSRIEEAVLQTDAVNMGSRLLRLLCTFLLCASAVAGNQPSAPVSLANHVLWFLSIILQI